MHRPVTSPSAPSLPPPPPPAAAATGSTLTSSTSGLDSTACYTVFTRNHGSALVRMLALDLSRCFLEVHGVTEKVTHRGHKGCCLPASNL
ncbi:hypothetical protein WMY93_024065 [Mugilogobius chulae]|uniref:Uncharacterized protein n=1 Tax=Mugilogobius chulae TaxID=88201 RepID=A0AAW0NBR8_9GOBI